MPALPYAEADRAGILGGVALAVGAWFLAHRHGHLRGMLSAYYVDSTWETKFPSFRSSAEPNVYQRLPDGTAVLDGYPVIWTDVLQPYGTAGCCPVVGSGICVIPACVRSFA